MCIQVTKIVTILNMIQYMYFFLLSNLQYTRKSGRAVVFPGFEWESAHYREQNVFFLGEILPVNVIDMNIAYCMRNYNDESK